MEDFNYLINLNISYSEKIGDILSESKKFTWSLPIRPHKAINVTVKTVPNKISIKTEYFFQLTINNVSQKDLMIDDMELVINNSSLDKIELENFLVSQTGIQLNYGETYSCVVSLSKEFHLFDS